MKYFLIVAGISVPLSLNGTFFTIHTSQRLVNQGVEFLTSVAPSIDKLTKKFSGKKQLDFLNGCALLLIGKIIKLFAAPEIFGKNQEELNLQRSPRVLPWKKAIPEQFQNAENIQFLQHVFKKAAQDMIRNRFMTYLCKTYIRIIMKTLTNKQKKDLSRKIGLLIEEEKVIRVEQ